MDEAESNLAKWEAQKNVLTLELNGLAPQLAEAQEKVIDAVINGNPKAPALRQAVNDHQARKLDLELALQKLHALIEDARLDLVDARNAAYQTRTVELAKEINRVGVDAVKSLKTTIELFDQHEIFLSELTTLTLHTQRAGMPQVERESVIQFRRANEALDEVLSEVEWGTLSISKGKSILDDLGIQKRIDRINARNEAIGKSKQDYLNGKVGGSQ